MNNETLILISTIGLVLSIIPATLHAIEVLWPMQARWIVNLVLPFFTFTLPNGDTALTYGEQIKMLDAALASVPAAKQRAKADYVFLLLFEQRQGAIGFTAVAAGAIYGLTLSLVERNPLHFLYGIVALLMMLANANHAGISFLGHHPRVSKSGRNVGIVFAPFWLVLLVLNGLAFVNTLG